MTLSDKTLNLIIWLEKRQGGSLENQAFCLLTKAYLDKLRTESKDGRDLGKKLREYHKHLHTHQHLLANGARDYQQSFDKVLATLAHIVAPKPRKAPTLDGLFGTWNDLD